MQLIIAGFFVCLDSFLSLLTIMPARIAMAVWRVLNTRWVIRVLTPVYAHLLPSGPLPWRLVWTLFWTSLTYIMLAIWKILVGLSLRRLATWYIKLRRDRKQHMD
ncbi:hypothetical protein BHE74_00002640 [Ensete ventricosum]|nr:hypothetical protein BHE74_00002640 [Ensete ventricosum]